MQCRGQVTEFRTSPRYLDIETRDVTVRWSYNFGSCGGSFSRDTRLREGRPGFNSCHGQWWDFFSHCLRVQTATRVHPASYPMGTGGSYPRRKAAGFWSWPLIHLHL